MPVPRSIQLAELLDALGPAARLNRTTDETAGRIVIRGVTYDSRLVEPGWLFCCVPGSNVDGHRFADEAADRGAAVLLVEHPLATDLPQIEVADARLSMAVLADAFWGRPSQRLTVIGVTGTNGKTTVTHMLAAILGAGGRRTEVLGTLSGPRTTPEAADLQAILAGLADDGVDTVAMEVSSHALALHRVDGVRFRLAIFTNLTRDHLDFHPTMEAYFQAKARLFEPERTDQAVVNLDDPHGRLLRVAAVVPTVGYEFADVADVEFRASGTRFTWRGRSMWLPLAGRHNLSNALAAATAAEQLGLGPDAVGAGLAALQPVPGRFEAVDAGQSFSVLVDYAHTPDGLGQVLESAREMVPSQNRVVVVFGCGGDRDRTKRAPMGEIAGRLADVVVITNDNPRSEPPLGIIEQIRVGVVAGVEVVVEPDRRAAIALALDRARPGDLVVIAGKGHETTQIFAEGSTEFDDRAVARALLVERAR